MATILNTKSIYFNDVNLMPNCGKVKSRKDVPNELYRIIVSPMLAVVGETFINEASKLGLSITTPRFISINKKEKLNDLFNSNKKNEKQICFLSIGLSPDKSELDYIKCIKNKNILIDIASGYIPHLKDSISNIVNNIGEIDNLMVGNVINDIGVYKIVNELDGFYKNLLIRIGIGNGGACKSSDVTAVNRGQITELIECDSARKSFNKNNIFLATDGGLYKAGFAIKAFGAGADYCLVGGYFSRALEAETHISGDGMYFGCASDKQNKMAGLIDKISEGKEFSIDKKELKPLDYLVKELWGGISSGISYVGYSSVSEFIGNGVFEIKQNSLPPKNRY